MNKTLIVAALATLSAAANAIIVETEPNNSIATADVITPGVIPYSDTGDIRLTAGDVDYFSLGLPSSVALSVIATPLAGSFTIPDTYLGLFDAQGNVLALNDDAGPGTGSLLMYEITAPGTYYIGVTGTGDDLWQGNHTQAGNYQLTVSVSPVPEPASMAALGLGALGLIRRRRNGAKR